MTHRPADSRWRLAVDVLSARVLVWIASAGRDVELTADAHLYFADRYHRLAGVHRAAHRVGRAREMEEKARAHLRASGNDGPPYAAAMALPRPRQLVVTDAIAGRPPQDPDAA